MRPWYMYLGLLLAACTYDDISPDGLEVGYGYSQLDATSGLQGIYFPTLGTDGDEQTVWAALSWRFGTERPPHPLTVDLWERQEAALRDQPPPAAPVSLTVGSGPTEDPGGSWAAFLVVLAEKWWLALIGAALLAWLGWAWRGQIVGLFKVGFSRKRKTHANR